MKPAGTGGHRQAAREGAVLGMALIVMVLLSVVGGVLLTMTRFQAVSAARLVGREQAFWAAEAGLQQARALMSAYSDQSFEDMGYFGEGVIAGSTASGTYSVDIEERAGWVNAGSLVKQYDLTATGTSAGGEVVVLTQRARMGSLGEFVMASYYSQQPGGGPIYFGLGDYIEGPMFSNSAYDVWGNDGDPVFTPCPGSWDVPLDVVATAAAGPMNLNGATTEAVFGSWDDDDDVTTPEVSRLLKDQPEVDFGVLEEFFDDLKTSAGQAGGLVLNGDYTVSFLEDGSLVYDNGSGPQTNSLSALTKPVYINGTLRISGGRVNGSAVLVAERAVYVDGDIVYESATDANAPWTADGVRRSAFNPDYVNDALMIVSRDQVQVTGNKNTFKKPNPDYRRIDAAVVVTEYNGNASHYGFNAENWDGNIGKPELRVLGSMIQYQRGLLARPPNPQAGGTAPSPFGFQKNILYDVRFGRCTAGTNVQMPSSGYSTTRWRQEPAELGA